LDAIGVHDDFFDLGGDSLTGVGLLVRIRSAFDVDLELASLFERSTISGLSEAIDLLAVTGFGERSDIGPTGREEFDL
jgi:acyl carrier protein